MNDLEGLKKIGTNFFDYLANKSYLQGMLKAMMAQKNEAGEYVQVDSAACFKNFESFTAELATKDFNDIVAAKNAYELSRKNKGQQGATEMGFWVSFYGEYQSTIISGFNFYNECQLDYYAKAIGNGVQNPTGLANLAVAMGY